MSTDENKALLRRFYAEIDAGNIEAMDELVAEDYVDHDPPPFPGLPAGREGLKHAFRIFWAATPGRHEIEDQIAEGDKVVTRLIAYGRHEGELPGPLPATGADMRSASSPSLAAQRSTKRAPRSPAPGAHAAPTTRARREPTSAPPDRGG